MLQKETRRLYYSKHPRQHSLSIKIKLRMRKRYYPVTIFSKQHKGYLLKYDITLPTSIDFMPSNFTHVNLKYNKSST